MIRLADILKESEYAHYRNLRYGLTEQEEGNWFTNWIKDAGQEYVKYKKAETEAHMELARKLYEYRHGLLDIAEIATLFWPPVSAAIGAAHAGLYFYEGDPEMGVLYLVFAGMTGLPPAPIKWLAKYIKALKTGDQVVAKSIEQGLGQTEKKALEKMSEMGARKSGEEVVKWTSKGLAQNADFFAREAFSNQIGKFASKLPAQSLKPSYGRVVLNILKYIFRYAGKFLLGGSKFVGTLYVFHHILKVYHWLWETYYYVGQSPEEFSKELGLDNTINWDSADPILKQVITGESTEKNTIKLSSLISENSNMPDFLGKIFDAVEDWSSQLDETSNSIIELMTTKSELSDNEIKSIAKTILSKHMDMSNAPRKKRAYIDSGDVTQSVAATDPNAKQAAAALYKSMKGLGTDETLLFKTLQDMIDNPTWGYQAVVEFNSNSKYNEGDDLKSWLEGDLSFGSERKALEMLDQIMNTANNTSNSGGGGW